LGPNFHGADVEIVFEHRHAYAGVEYEAEEVWKVGVGNAVGCPWAVVVHFGYTSVCVTRATRGWNVNVITFHISYSDAPLVV
jgi:hypothetical protein